MTTSTLYRFEPIANLLESRELEHHTIYLENPKKINTHTKIFRKFIWDGDYIVWENLFRHYLFSVIKTKIYLALTNNKIQLDLFPLETMPNDDKAFTDPHEQKQFEFVYHAVKKHLYLHELIEKLTTKPCSQPTLHRYLQLIHLPLILIIQHYMDAENCSKLDQLLIDSCQTTAKILVTLASTDNEHQNYDELDHYLFERSQILIKLLQDQQKNDLHSYKAKLLISDFPSLYLTKIEAMTHAPSNPSLFLTSFIQNYQQRSSWENYAQNHTGVCLIFEIKQSAFLIKNRESDYFHNPYSFYPINYNEPIERNFFESLANLSWKTMYAWHRDQNKNLSRFGEYLLGNETKWQESFWKEYYQDLVTKPKDRAYETEQCLIIEEKNPKTATMHRHHYFYDQHQMSGIIFGMNASSSNINTTISIIKQGAFRSDFKFYQAYYCHDENQMKKRLLPI